jgi:hypothetical protein
MAWRGGKKRDHSHYGYQSGHGWETGFGMHRGLSVLRAILLVNGSSYVEGILYDILYHQRREMRVVLVDHSGICFGFGSFSFSSK